jgi:hypothetical protein
MKQAESNVARVRVVSGLTTSSPGVEEDKVPQFYCKRVILSSFALVSPFLSA